MLQAILHSKGGRIRVNDDTQSWRELFRCYEDLLTAVFFGRMQYLSDKGLLDTLNVLLPEVDIDLIGEFRSIEYWPKHNRFQEKSYVEPDILIEFVNARLLIEVKRPTNTQFLSQWESEIKALTAQEEVEEADQLIFLALGGLGSKWKDDILELEGKFPGLIVCALDWEAVSDAISVLLEKSEDNRDRKIYEDWLAAFGLYGIRLQVRPYDQLEKMSFSPDWRELISQIPVIEVHCLPAYVSGDWEQLNKFKVDNYEEIRQWR